MGNAKGLLDYLLVLPRKFQVAWLKVIFLGEAEATLRLGIKAWWVLVK